MIRQKSAISLQRKIVYSQDKIYKLQANVARWNYYAIDVPTPLCRFPTSSNNADFTTPSFIHSLNQSLEGKLHLSVSSQFASGPYSMD